MRDGLGIALACNDLDWTRVWQVARRNCTVGRMVGVAAIGDAWLIETQGGFWPKPGRSAVSGGNRVHVPAGRVITNKQTICPDYSKINMPVYFALQFPIVTIHLYVNG
jgi:hypothetical protein